MNIEVSVLEDTPERIEIQVPRTILDGQILERCSLILNYLGASIQYVEADVRK